MLRNDWKAVYLNQDRILTALKPLQKEIFLAGGTGLHRFVFNQPYRHSEDLDFFFPKLQNKNRVAEVGAKMAALINTLPNANTENEFLLKDEQSYRFWCHFNDNDEIIKIELLNFTCNRLKDTSFINNLFKTENLYNILLYKFKALCDRPDTIKDLFDLYFILREFNNIDINTLISDINIKFEKAIGISYKREHIIKALEHNLKWDIEIGNIDYPYDLQIEIKEFQQNLKSIFETKDILNFSYQNRIKNRANQYKLDIQTYLELIDVLEYNNFFIKEVKKTKFYKNRNITL